MGEKLEGDKTCGFIKRLTIRGEPYSYFGEISLKTGLPQGLGVLDGVEDLIIGEITPKITHFGASIHI